MAEIGRTGTWGDAAVMKKYLDAYREQISYLFFGVLTMLINYGLFWALDRLFQGRRVLLANLLTFAAATAFAYVTNKWFVFRSRQWGLRSVVPEAAAFVASRLFSFAVEEAGLYVSAYVLFLGRYRWCGVDGVMLSKIALSLAATVLNYFFSKFWVFSARKRKK